jgi:SAM-dependent methyltransferase
MTRDDLRSVYEAQALDPAHPDHWSGPAEMVDRIARRLGTGPNHLVLDVGCGVGGPARRLARLGGCAVIAVDPLPSVVREARSRTPPVAAIPGIVRYAVGRAEQLPIATGSVDQVWCLGVVAHVEDRTAFALEAARVLRPGGAMVVTEGFAASRRRPRFLGSAPLPWTAVPAYRLVADLREAGFADVTVERWPGTAGDAEGTPGSTGVPALDADLREGTVLPAMVVARAAGTARAARYSAGSTGPA